VFFGSSWTLFPAYFHAEALSAPMAIGLPTDPVCILLVVIAETQIPMHGLVQDL
jgi:hypothetical protein